MRILNKCLVLKLNRKVVSIAHKQTADRQTPSSVLVYKLVKQLPLMPQMVLKLHLCHEDSEYVLSFEIGQWKGGFYSG